MVREFGRILLYIAAIFTISICGGCSGGTRGTNVGSSGTVKTETGEPIQGAEITDELSGQMAVTNESGEYLLVGIPPNAETALTVKVEGEEATFEIRTTSRSIEANFIFNSATKEITADIKEKSSEDSDKEGGGLLEGPSPTPSSKPTPQPGSGDASNGKGEGESGNGSGTKSPPTPTPSTTPMPGGGEPELIRNRKLEACLESKFFVGTSALPDLSCERECAKEATENSAGFQAFYFDECVANSNFLSNSIVPRCREFACIEFCGAIIAQDPTHWVSEQISEARANTSCEGAE